MSSIGEECPRCGKDNWYIIDEDYLYKKSCKECPEIICIEKQDFVKKFECPDCGGLSGTLEENDQKLGVRCNNCGKLHIMLEKKGVCEDRRTNGANKNPQPQSISSSTNASKSIPKCPTCGSTKIKRISASSKVGNIMLFGLFGNKRKKQFHCNDCKYEW